MNSNDDTPLLYPRETWMRAGSCLGVDPDLFFPERKGDDVYTEARPICEACPVTDDCLEYALVHNIKLGMWGAKTPRERNALRKQLGYVVPKTTG